MKLILFSLQWVVLAANLWCYHQYHTGVNLFAAGYIASCLVSDIVCEVNRG